ncbi:MAG: Glu-tRNA(Gln) amidotransferase subunit GatE [Candidatus Methanoplasma sp.]|jgi:glutamyl-tRNA(Gln) amidotransferase subunit E|nr:Glu-tRNA(Gln) amidotransferase subunit GatE [Candidatus Methanoplasma sp.]
MSEEMKCGIEIHQQLETGKLFCSCDSALCETGKGAYFRKLRPTTGETGEIDRAALVQFKRGMGFRYQRCDEASCLVELDEEPPHPVNESALETALTYACMLDADVIDEIQFMRKIVVDGSNTSGFQRTSLISTGGSVEVNGRKIGILSICLEEDAARKIETKGDEVTYRLDRLGIPLVEVATAPDMTTPEEVMEVALRLGTLLRATKKVKRGIGTIREDVNISIPGGARIEIKGVQELRMLPDFVRNEIGRQKMLLRIKDVLADRGTQEALFEPVDVTAVLKDCPSKVIKGALDDKGKVIAVRLRGFAGVMNGDDGTLRLGSEMAQYARTKGVKGIFHSDELPNYGIEQQHVDALREALRLPPDEAFVICAAAEKRANEALRTAVERANEALKGVPEETRDPQPDGTTRYSRPLPGAARMYPETDVPPEEITQERLERIRSNLPEFPEQTEARLTEKYGINRQQASQLVRQSHDELFSEISDAYGMAAVAATMLTNTYTELERDGSSPESVSDASVMELFSLLKQARFSKEAVPALLREMASGTGVEAAIKKLGLESVDSGEAAGIISKIVKEREEFVRSKGMDAAGPLMGPVMGALRGKLDGKQASDLLEAAIKKLISKE